MQHVETTPDVDVIAPKKPRKPSLPKKMMRSKVFAYWLLKNMKTEEVITEEQFIQIVNSFKIHEDIETQLEFYKNFEVIYKDIVKDMKKGIKQQHTPPKKKRTYNKKPKDVVVVHEDRPSTPIMPLDLVPELDMPHDLEPVPHEESVDVVVTTEPVVVTPEPVVVTPEPVVVTPEPVVVTPEPVVVTPEPVVVTPVPGQMTTSRPKEKKAKQPKNNNNEKEQKPKKEATAANTEKKEPKEPKKKPHTDISSTATAAKKEDPHAKKEPKTKKTQQTTTTPPVAAAPVIPDRKPAADESADEEESSKIDVHRITIQGKNYLIDYNSNMIYDVETHDEIGKYDKNTGEIIECEDDDDDDDDEVN